MGNLTKIQKCLAAYDLRRQATYPNRHELHLARQRRDRAQSPEPLTAEEEADFNFLEERRAMLFAIGQSHGVVKDADVAPRIAFVGTREGEKHARKESEEELVLLRSNLAEARAKVGRYRGRMEIMEERLAETKAALNEKADESVQCANLEGQLEQLVIEAAKKEEELGRYRKKVEELRGSLSGYEKEKAERARLISEVSRLRRENSGLYERVGKEEERARQVEERLERAAEEMEREREEMRRKEKDFAEEKRKLIGQHEAAEKRARGMSAQRDALLAELTAIRSSDPDHRAVQDLHTSLSHLATTIPQPVPGFLSLVLTELPNSTGRAATIYVTPTRVTVVLGGSPVDVLITPRADAILIVWRDMQPYVAMGPRVFFAGEPNDALTVGDFGRDNGIYADDQMPQLNHLLDFLDSLYP